MSTRSTGVCVNTPAPLSYGNTLNHAKLEKKLDDLLTLLLTLLLREYDDFEIGTEGWLYHSFFYKLRFIGNF